MSLIGFKSFWSSEYSLEILWCAISYAHPVPRKSNVFLPLLEQFRSFFIFSMYWPNEPQDVV
jgi:hypothetical protein